jgi:hypothetical protein
VGAARNGNADGARKEVARFAMLREAMIAQKKDYWVKQLDVQVQAVSAWIGRVEDRDNEALQGLRAAAAVEEQTEKHIMMPGSVMPSLSLRSRCCRGRPATSDAPRGTLRTGRTYRGRTRLRLADTCV